MGDTDVQQRRSPEDGGTGECRDIPARREHAEHERVSLSRYAWERLVKEPMWMPRVARA
jgi:hypothetical protein